jgi:uncharacterized protein YbaA (DUF1428 family)
MGKYVDGFILVVPSDKTDAYKEMASGGRDIWMKHGALAYFECRADDLKPQEMGPEKTRRFDDMAGAKEGETVWFSFVVYKSKEHRDEVNAKVMEEMSHQDGPEVMPFDMTRMAYGGFAVEVEG